MLSLITLEVLLFFSVGGKMRLTNFLNMLDSYWRRFMQKKLVFSGALFQDVMVSVEEAEDVYVLKNVVLVGLKGDLDAQILKNSVDLFNGVPSFFNHLNVDYLSDDDAIQAIMDRPPEEIFGYFKNPSFDSSRGIVADFHFFKADERTQKFVQLVRAAPNLVGFSFVGFIQKDIDGNISSIEKIFSVDIVQFPKYSDFLFGKEEAMSDNKELVEARKTIKQLENELKQARDELKHTKEHLAHLEEYKSKLEKIEKVKAFLHKNSLSWSAEVEDLLLSLPEDKWELQKKFLQVESQSKQAGKLAHNTSQVKNMQKENISDEEFFSYFN